MYHPFLLVLTFLLLLRVATKNQSAFRSLVSDVSADSSQRYAHWTLIPPSPHIGTVSTTVCVVQSHASLPPSPLCK